MGDVYAAGRFLDSRIALLTIPSQRNGASGSTVPCISQFRTQENSLAFVPAYSGASVMESHHLPFMASASHLLRITLQPNLANKRRACQEKSLWSADSIFLLDEVR
jgi:hypothetical protein